MGRFPYLISPKFGIGRQQKKLKVVEKSVSLLRVFSVRRTRHFFVLAASANTTVFDVLCHAPVFPSNMATFSGLLWWPPFGLFDFALFPLLLLH